MGTSKSPIHVQCNFLPSLTNLPLKLGKTKHGMNGILTWLKHAGSTVLSDLHLIDHLNFNINYKEGTIILTILQIRNGVIESSSNLPKICGISILNPTVWVCSTPTSPSQNEPHWNRNTYNKSVPMVCAECTVIPLSQVC